MTAIRRTHLSAPARYLVERGLLVGHILDYGSGRGDLIPFSGLSDVSQYDPHWFPEKPEGRFETVYCGYVLNTLKREQWKEVLVDIFHYLKRKGHGYIAVRRDIKKEGLTSRGTLQYNVILPYECPVETKDYAIYILHREW